MVGHQIYTWAVTGWAAALSEYDFPQLQGDLCPITEPSNVRISFDWVPSGRPHDLLVFGSPTDNAFSVYHAAGARFGINTEDRGYVVDFTAYGEVRLYRSDGRAHVTKLQSARVPQEHGVRSRRFDLVVDGGFIALHTVVPALPMIAVSDTTYRGGQLHIVRRMSPQADLNSPEGHFDGLCESLEPSPFTRLSVQRAYPTEPEAPPSE